ncbi:GNAT family N-acetyltransferase [Paenibacillus barcinonensis]|uniref:GNAT acetyltransferase-like protein n=1 Tax=Paenibacillus barcinonensis TaxID=198119 RepID=A0A2V4VNU0_PAEBA|nr:GNAT family N-acetyltransferase [Paenibacillus barcinonensis]PYE47843.1 GNAT acetyltransferase-like protein [Paenibacillus barcinonensis]QKS59062.1 GNAT family N-acetyltransferase [Paenibacillus barcinonensis]
MRKLTLDEYASVLPLLDSIQNKAVYALSVIHGTQEGCVYVNEGKRTTSVFITSCGGFYGLAGDETNDAFTQDVIQYMNNESNHPDFFALGVYTKDWENKLHDYHIKHSRKISRTYYRFNQDRFINSYGEFDITLEKPFKYYPLDLDISTIYREQFYPYYQLVWSSAEQFCAHGIGHFIMKHDELISVCTSPYVGGGYAEIDVITIEQYQRKGLASVVGLHFIQDCLSRNLIPNWSCHTDNAASNELARKLGFEEIGEHSMYWYHV